MPALPDVPSVIRSDYHLTWAEDTHIKCREFWQYTGGPPTNSDLSTLCTTMITAWDTHLKTLMYSAVELIGVENTDLTSSTAAYGAQDAAVIGTRSGHGMSAATCTLLSQQIHRRYRGGHSRIYLPFGVQEDLHDAQTWSSDYVSEADTKRAAYVTEIQGDLPAGLSSLVQCSVSYYAGFTVHTGTTGRARNVSTPRSTPIVDLVIAEAVKVGVALIRKRLLGLA